MKTLRNRSKAAIVLMAAGFAATLASFIISAKSTLSNARGEGFTDTAVKILISIVIGALLLAGLYVLFNAQVIPTLSQRIRDLFNYTG